MPQEVGSTDMKKWFNEVEPHFASDLKLIDEEIGLMGKVDFITRSYIDKHGNVCQVSAFGGRDGVGGRVFSSVRPNYSKISRRAYPETFIGQGKKLITIVKTGDVELKYKRHMVNAFSSCQNKSLYMKTIEDEYDSYPDISEKPKAKILKITPKRLQSKGRFTWRIMEYELELDSPLGSRCYHSEADFATKKNFNNSLPKVNDEVVLFGGCTNKKISSANNIYYGRTVAVSGQRYPNLYPLIK